MGLQWLLYLLMVGTNDLHGPRQRLYIRSGNSDLRTSTNAWTQGTRTTSSVPCHPAQADAERPADSDAGCPPGPIFRSDSSEYPGAAPLPNAGTTPGGSPLGAVP